jgi:hypothetical protein
MTFSPGLLRECWRFWYQVGKIYCLLMYCCRTFAKWRNFAKSVCRVFSDFVLSTTSARKKQDSKFRENSSFRWLVQWNNGSFTQSLPHRVHRVPHNLIFENAFLTLSIREKNVPPMTSFNLTSEKGREDKTFRNTLPETGSIFFGGKVLSRVARWYIFKPKIAIWVNFEGSCSGKCWYIFCRFGLFYGNLIYFMDIW